MFSKKIQTKQKTKQNKKTVSNYVFNPLLRSSVHHTWTSQTDLMCIPVDWFLYNRQIFQGKGL